MELQTYTRILWKRRWVILLTTAVVMVVAIAGTFLTKPVYSATTIVRVLTSSTGLGSAERYDIGYTDRLMRTYVEIATSNPVMDELVTKLNIRERPKVTVEIVPVTELISISAEADSPAQAANVANTLADVFIARSSELYSGKLPTASEVLGQQLAGVRDALDQYRNQYDTLLKSTPQNLDQLSTLSRTIQVEEQLYASLKSQYEEALAEDRLRMNRISVVEAATVPSAPSRPNKVLNILLSFLIGISGGAALAFLLNAWDTRLYNPEQIEGATHLRILGQIPAGRPNPQGTLFDIDSRQGEAFRRLYINIANLNSRIPNAESALSDTTHQSKGATKLIMVTSARPGEGKSTVVANLAYTMSQFGKKVVVIDCDFRRPTLHTLFNLSNAYGLSTLLARSRGLPKRLTYGISSGVRVITSGPTPEYPAGLLGSPRMIALLEQCAQQFDVVLLDTPALAGVMDAVTLTTHVDGVILVVGRGLIKREVVDSICQQLTNANARLLGIVVNWTSKGSDEPYYRYYHQKARPMPPAQEPEDAVAPSDG